MLSKENPDGSVTVVTSSDMAVTGHSNVKRMRTYRSAGQVVTARDIDLEDLFWVAPLLVMVLSIAAMLTEADTSGTVIAIVTLAAVVATVRARQEGDDIPSVWTEMGLLAVTGVLFWHPFGAGAFFIGVGSLAVLARYAYLWRERRAWEPFVCSFVFLALLALVQYEVLTFSFMPVAFILPAYFGGIGTCWMIFSCLMKESGSSSIRD